jgi:hypothetical protein
MIFDYNTFETNKKPETRWIIQPKEIETDVIQLRKLKFDS